MIKINAANSRYYTRLKNFLSSTLCGKLIKRINILVSEIYHSFKIWVLPNILSFSYDSTYKVCNDFIVQDLKWRNQFWHGLWKKYFCLKPTILLIIYCSYWTARIIIMSLSLRPIISFRLQQYINILLMPQDNVVTYFTLIL